MKALLLKDYYTLRKSGLRALAHHRAAMER